MRSVEIKQKICATGAIPFIISFLLDGKVQKEISLPGLLGSDLDEIQHWIYDGILP